MTQHKLAALALSLSLGAALTACSSHAGESAAPRTPVRVAAATSGPATPAILTNGTIANKDEIPLSFKVGGVIHAIHVEEGASVHAGEPLAEIELTEINAQLEQVRALATKAQRDLARGERLYADEVISLEQLQDLRTQAATAQAQLRGVEFNRGYAVITAPGDGVVLRKLAQEREIVPAGQTVLLVGGHDKGYVVRAALADRELVQLQIGDPCEVRLDAYPGQVLHARLSQIASAADQRTGMFPVEARLDAPPAALASGLVAKLRLYPAAGRTHTLTYVPMGAVVEGSGDTASVFVVHGDRAQRRQVRVAFIDPTGVALAAGLAPGERVVTDGALYLEDNDVIEIVTDPARVAGNF
ncbi:MAG TPA: efflux RND transporter periplasmic adaptor subunit [Steroidobacteraceae bacterium]|jgi:RND family efflux transporter MFP subunit